MLLLLPLCSSNDDASNSNSRRNIRRIRRRNNTLRTTIGKSRCRRHISVWMVQLLVLLTFEMHYSVQSFSIATETSIRSYCGYKSVVKQQREFPSSSFLNTSKRGKQFCRTGKSNNSSVINARKSAITRRISNVDEDYFRSNNNESDQRYSADDWYQNVKSMRHSTILRKTRNPILSVMAWSTLLCQLYKSSVLHPYVLTTLLPHSMTVSTLGLLLVFRTNSAYSKFCEGRVIWEKIHNKARNLSRVLYLYSEDFTPAVRTKICHLLALYPYLLHHHVMDSSTTETENSNASNTRISIPDELVAYMDTTTNGFQQKQYHPLWVCDEMGYEITKVRYSATYTNREREKLLNYINDLSTYVGMCERIHQTAVPMNYARHSLRALTFWLYTLPLAIVPMFGYASILVMGCTSWMMYGIYEIGYTIEDPFQGTSLRLSTMCYNIYKDVIVLNAIRTTAFYI